MKTASKLLSMLLLVAMCLSLMGGSAYALSLEPAGSDLALELPAEEPSAVPAESSTSDLNLEGSEVVPEGSVALELEIPSKLTAESNIWNGEYADLETAAKNITSIKLHGKALSPEDPGGTISRNVTIDLNGKALVFTGILTVNANVTIENGTLSNANMITVGEGYTLTLSNVTKIGDIAGKGQVTVTKDYIATIGSEKFATLDKAFEYAAKQPGTVTINMIDDTSKLENYSIPAMPATMSCDAIVLNLSKNCLEGPLPLEAKVSLTINGGSIVGDITAALGNVTLNNTTIDGKISVTGKTLTVSSSKVDAVSLNGGTLYMGSGSEITSLTVNDASGAQSVLKVSGGVVKAFTKTAGNAYRAITGGEWTVNDPTSLEYLRNCVADGLTLKGTENPYTVGSGAGTGSGSGGSGIVTGDFTVVGSPYTKGSGNTVYVLMPYASHNGHYYWSTLQNPTHTTQINEIPSAYYDAPTLVGSQYKLILKNSFLDSLSAGTIYLGTCNESGNYRTMGALTINGSGTIVTPGDVAVWPVDSSEWYSGDGMYYFYVTPALQLVEGKTYNYYDVRIDDVLLGGDKFTYNGYQKFGVASSVMDSLSIGTHTITVLTPSGYASCNFRIGATLRPVDTDKHVTGSSKNLQFVCSAPIQSVWVGGRQLTDVDYGDYWTLSSSRKTVTLSAKFLNNRTAGETYTIGVVTDNGDRPSCTFKILTTAQASASPKTGDESNLALWAAVLILSGGAAVAVLPRLKKHED